MRHACGAPAARDASANRDTAAIDASASPRKPSVAIASRSSAVASFDVACRATASGEIVAADARAVVGDADAPDAAAFDVDVDLRRAGVERVLEQLLQRDGRTLDDLAGGDLVDEMVGQRADACHRVARGRKRRIRVIGTGARHAVASRGAGRLSHEARRPLGVTACRKRPAKSASAYDKFGTSKWIRTRNRGTPIESPYAWARLAVSLLLMTIGGAGMYSVAVVLPRLAAEFGAARADVSLPYTLTMIGFGFGGILMGRLSDRFGVMVPVLVGTVGLGAGFIAAGSAASLWQFSARARRA